MAFGNHCPNSKENDNWSLFSFTDSPQMDLPLSKFCLSAVVWLDYGTNTINNSWILEWITSITIEQFFLFWSASSALADMFWSYTCNPSQANNANAKERQREYRSRKRGRKKIKGYSWKGGIRLRPRRSQKRVRGAGKMSGHDQYDEGVLAI